MTKQANNIVDKKNDAKPVIDNTEAVKAFHAQGGRILHIRPLTGYRGMTFAFIRKGGRIQFSTAVQHRNDTFTKKVGTQLALEHFNAGQTVFMPVPKDYSSVNFLSNIGYYAG